MNFEKEMMNVIRGRQEKETITHDNCDMHEEVDIDSNLKILLYLLK